jgi:hypothetical protein
MTVEKRAINCTKLAVPERISPIMTNMKMEKIIFNMMISTKLEKIVTNPSNVTIPIHISLTMTAMKMEKNIMNLLNITVPCCTMMRLVKLHQLIWVTGMSIVATILRMCLVVILRSKLQKIMHNIDRKTNRCFYHWAIPQY